MKRVIKPRKDEYVITLSFSEWEFLQQALYVFLSLQENKKMVNAKAYKMAEELFQAPAVKE